MFFSLSMLHFAATILALTFGLCFIHAPFKHSTSSNLRLISTALAASLLAKALLASTGLLLFWTDLFGFITWATIGVVIGKAVAMLFFDLRSQIISHDNTNGSQTTKKSSNHINYKDIIKAENATVHFQNLLSKEAARAQPNQRLQAAFGIDNCFVTDDKKRCAEFRSKVVKLIHVEHDKWQDFAAAAKAISQKEFDTTDNTIKLFSLIQLVTMKMTRKVMWNFDPQANDNDEAIRRLADEVNKQWLRSKGAFNPGDKPDWHFDQQHDLQNALNEAFPNWTDENPLNLILPGYETMWRVVLRCFVEVTSRAHTKAPQWKKVLNKFLANPTRAQLDDNSYGLSAAILAKETLRLYPPTRRIYRAFKDKETGYDFLVAADVEKMHQDEEIWGDTARLFDHSRWLDVDEKKEDEIFMPFGAAPFRCPAKQHKEVYMPFGVAMIALLVGALVEAVDGTWVCEGEFPGNGRPLSTDREAYKEAVLRRV